MLFNSFEFIFVFLPLAWLGFYAIGRRSQPMAALWLAGASMLFYALWNWRFVLLLLLSIGFNYAVGYRLGRMQGSSRLKLVLTAGVAGNLAVLAVFKYTDFFLSSANSFLGLSLPLPHIILPLGISFYTFTQIAFLVDVYRGYVREYRLVHYILFVTYFPHLIAGPVIHHRDMMPQFAAARTYRPHAEDAAVGLAFFTLGLAKKLLLADVFAQYAAPVFAGAKIADPMFFSAWTGAIAYALQLYFDFSGYSDMAVGLSRMFGVRLPYNFHSPYKARNIIEFWQRWHITLSTFLKDYLYVPLGGNRKGPARRYMNLMTTMLLGGLWHGANWTFVVWGGLHGLFLVVNHGWRALKPSAPASPSRAPRLARALAAHALTLMCVVVAWVFFRADSLAVALTMLRGMAGFNGLSLPQSAAPLLGGLPGIEFAGLWGDVDALATQSLPRLAGYLMLALGIVWLLPASQDLIEGQAQRFARLRWRPNLPWALATGVLLAISLLSMQQISEFLYFQF